jgi:TPR repeat protein
MMKRVAANDAASIYMLACCYFKGIVGLQQDRSKAMELYARAAELGFSKAHNNLGGVYDEGGYMKKAKFHYEAAAMAGYEVARYNIGIMEVNDGNVDRAVKHLRIAASAGHYNAMHQLRTAFEKGIISRESIKSTLKAYNNSCAEMRSEAREEFIQFLTETDKTASNNT